MLRSLVGSEMCIRDSPRPAPDNKQTLAGTGRCCRPGTVDGRYPIRDSSVCLLYTSDAADDLLCVDLGGRRIIKKKNIQQPY